jgi:hypothetical protein
MLLTKDYKRYLRMSFSSEDEIERVVLDNISLLFGDYACLLPKAKLVTLGGKGTIPDGVLINFETKQWFIIEVERGTHRTWEHIAPQVSKQLTAIVNEESKAKILVQALDEIKSRKDFKDLLSEINIEDINIHGELQAILSTPPIIALPIDEIPDDLEEWTKTLKNEVRIWIIEKYINDKNEIMYSIPDADQKGVGPSIDPAGGDNVEANKGSLMSRVVKAGILKVNDPVYIDYGPKGKAKTHFEGRIAEDGIEFEGKVYSPSIAALRCIQKISKDRTSSNGWVMWKTSDGLIIDEAFKKWKALPKN